MRRRVFSIVGFLLFAVLVSATIFFAEGYGVDVKEREIVKRGVVVLEGVSAPAEVPIEISVDGVPVDLWLPGELRLATGLHSLQIRSAGAVPWQKRLRVPEEEVVRFAPIRLLPSAGSLGMPLASVESFQVTFLPHGVFLFSPNLGFGKLFESDAPLRPEVFDEPAFLEAFRRKGVAVFPHDAMSSPPRHFFRIGKTFHALAMEDGLRLTFCDLDFENCQPLARLDRPDLAVSEDRTSFLLVSQGKLMWFDFAEPALLPRLIRRVVSFSSKSFFAQSATNRQASLGVGDVESVSRRSR